MLYFSKPCARGTQQGAARHDEDRRGIQRTRPPTPLPSAGSRLGSRSASLGFPITRSPMDAREKAQCSLRVDKLSLGRCEPRLSRSAHAGCRSACVSPLGGTGSRQFSPAY